VEVQKRKIVKKMGGYKYHRRYRNQKKRRKGGGKREIYGIMGTGTSGSRKVGIGGERDPKLGVNRKGIQYKWSLTGAGTINWENSKKVYQVC